MRRLLESKGEAPVTCTKLETVEEVLKAADVRSSFTPCPPPCFDLLIPSCSRPLSVSLWRQYTRIKGVTDPNWVLSTEHTAPMYRRGLPAMMCGCTEEVSLP